LAQNQSGPGRAGYILALGVFLLGLIGAGVLAAVFFFGLMGLGDDLQRVVGPGSDEIELTETGRYTVFYEYESRVDGVDHSTDREPPQIDIGVERLSDGAEIEVGRARGETSYSLREHSGESIRQFRVDEPGTYRITISYADGSQEPEVVLALGEGVGRGLLTSIGAFFGSGIIFCVLTMVAIGIAGFTFYRRYQADKRQVEGHPPSHSSVER
jgi:hypothetical protein